MFNLFGRGQKSDQSDEVQQDRLPPGQKITQKWPVLHAGRVPSFDRETWDFRIFGLVDQELVLTWDEFSSLPVVMSTSDMHCVTGWSKLDNKWEGVAARTVAGLAQLNPDARFVVVHAERGYTANMPLEVLHHDDALFAFKHNGKELTPEHGFPVRLVVPQLYFWKSVKWVRGLEFVEENRKGYWEQRGYHIEGDPWKEQRYSF